MRIFGCNCTLSCTGTAVIAAAIVGVLTAFLQITGVITLTPVALLVAFGIAVAYLAVLLLATGRRERCCRLCGALGAVLVGILGTILLALVLLAVGITAASVLSAILVGLLLFFFALLLTATACLVRCLGDCEGAA